MQYFDTLPKVIYTENGVSSVYTNLLARVSVIPQILKDPLIYYTYDIQEGDTPEIVADKYYGDSYRYWIVLYANEILDPQWNWPLNNQQFDNYLTKKYSSAANNVNVLAYTQSTIKEYRKTVKSIDSISLVETVDTFVIDEDTYNSPSIPSATYQLPNSTVSQTITKSIANIYDYELEKNEAKRSINLINKIYVSELEQQFKSLMSQ